MIRVWSGYHNVYDNFNVFYEPYSTASGPLINPECNYTGYYDRIAAFEVLELTDEMKDLVVTGASSLKIRELALQQGYKPLVIDAFEKVLNGITTVEEVNKRLALY